MSKAEKLRARFGGHMNESMNAGASGPGGSPGTTPEGSVSVSVSGPPGGSPGTGAGSLEGLTRFREASRISLERIMADPEQPRTEFPAAEILRLAESLKARGQLQPIRVRWSSAHGKYVILAGERRWRAAAAAGIAVMECVIETRDLTPEEVLRDQVVENCLREDLRPIEQARAFQRLMVANGWSLRQIGQELHLAHGTVVKALALLELPEAVQELVEQGAVKPATAYEIGKAATPDDQVELAARVVAEGLTRDQVTTAVKGRKAGAPLREAIVLDDGTRVTVTGAALLGGADAVAAALVAARERVLTRARGGARDHAA